MKKSRSSVPLFAESCPPGPAPPVRNEGLFATAGRPEPVPVPPLADPFVAIAVGKTKDGESLPAKPVIEINWILCYGFAIELTDLIWRTLYRYKYKKEC